MPRTGATVVVEGYLTSVERDNSKDNNLKHLDVAVENIYFSTGTRAAATERPFGELAGSAASHHV
jgi:hypothetical protein